MEMQTYGANSFTCRGSILCNALADDIKVCINVAAFKKKIKDWEGENCNYELCR